MDDKQVKRKLAAILALDVVGFSKLMHSNDVAAFELVRRMGREIFAPVVEQWNGTIFKHTGDGVLARFDSVNSAFEAAEEIIRKVIEAGEASLRIGIHLGDVIDDGGDVFGDSVNIACRLESLALHNGICVSERAWSDLRQRQVDFRDLGVQQLKNIETPIRVFLYDPSGTGDFATASVRRPQTGLRAHPWRVAGAAGPLTIAAVLAALLWLRPWANNEQEALAAALDRVPCSWLAARPIEQTPTRVIAHVDGYSNLPPDRVRELVLGTLAEQVNRDMDVDVSSVQTIPQLDCQFLEAAVDFKYEGVARAELVRTLAATDPVAFARYADRVPADVQEVYDVRLFTGDFGPHAELFVIDATDGLQHVRPVSEVRADENLDHADQPDVRHAMIWSDTSTPLLFFIVDSATPIAVASLTGGYRNLESLRAFRDAAQAGDWQIELVLLQQDQTHAQANP